MTTVYDSHPDIDYDSLKSELKTLIRTKVKHTDKGVAFLASDWTWLIDTVVDELEVAISKNEYWIYINDAPADSIIDGVEKVIHNNFGSAVNHLLKIGYTIPDNWTNDYPITIKNGPSNRKRELSLEIKKNPAHEE